MRTNEDKYSTKKILHLGNFSWCCGNLTKHIYCHYSFIFQNLSSTLISQISKIRHVFWIFMILTFIFHMSIFWARKAPRNSFLTIFSYYVSSSFYNNHIFWRINYGSTIFPFFLFLLNIFFAPFGRKTSFLYF